MVSKRAQRLRVDFLMLLKKVIKWLPNAKFVNKLSVLKLKDSKHIHVDQNVLWNLWTQNVSKYGCDNVGPKSM